MTCNNNLTFAAICDCSRNVYIYLQPEEKETVALQFVHAMGIGRIVISLDCKQLRLIYFLF